MLAATDLLVATGLLGTPGRAGLAALLAPVPRITGPDLLWLLAALASLTGLALPAAPGVLAGLALPVALTLLALLAALTLLTGLASLATLALLVLLAALALLASLAALTLLALLAALALLVLLAALGVLDPGRPDLLLAGPGPTASSRRRRSAGCLLAAVRRPTGDALLADPRRRLSLGVDPRRRVTTRAEPGLWATLLSSQPGLTVLSLPAAPGVLAGLPFLTAPSLLARLCSATRPELALLTGGLSALGLSGLLVAPFARHGAGPVLVLSLRRRAGLSLVLTSLASLVALVLFTLALSALALSTLLSAAILPSLTVLILVHAGALSILPASPGKIRASVDRGRLA